MLKGFSGAAESTCTHLVLRPLSPHVSGRVWWVLCLASPADCCIPDTLERCCAETWWSPASLYGAAAGLALEMAAHPCKLLQPILGLRPTAAAGVQCTKQSGCLHVTAQNTQKLIPLVIWVPSNVAGLKANTTANPCPLTISVNEITALVLALPPAPFTVVQTQSGVPACAQLAHF